jgi:two-component system sensor histidine kinase AlgZ
MQDFAATEAVSDSRPQPQAERKVEPFLPDMCTLQAVLLLVILGELLALALTLADSSLVAFDWENLGFRSFLMQWIVLLSAALLCPLRYRLSRLPPWLAGMSCYLLVLGVTLICSLLGLWAVNGWGEGDTAAVLSNLILAAIFAGIVLRYLYVQQQWSNQQKAELRARLQSLQARIHPHFLFNSMNSIASLIATEPEKAERMVEDLSSLFRANLAEPALVPLAAELELCRQYMAIEQIRLGERLRVHWQVAPEVESGQSVCALPSLLLQPLLENAIQHGIQTLVGGGLVSIEIWLEDDCVQVGIINPMATREQHPQGVRPRLQDNGMALNNIRHRLQAHFGTAAKFRAEAVTAADVEPHFVARLSYPYSS